jgi:hypothetical protein
MTNPTMTVELWVRDTGERVVSTFLAAATTWLLAVLTGTIDRATWVEALVAATFPPVIVVLMTALPALTYTGQVWWIDALTRVARSFVQGALGALAAGASFLEVSAWQAAAVAGGLAASTTAKSVLARFRVGTITPASFARAEG